MAVLGLSGRPKHAVTYKPVAFFNPTFGHLDASRILKPIRDPFNVYQLWRSRDNRKGRHALEIRLPQTSGDIQLPTKTNSPKSISYGIIRMFTWFPVWDISYDVAIIFTLGSVVWVINSFFAWLPLVDPSSTFSGESNAMGITAFVGATIFEIGSVLLLLEAVNENRTECFGWALEKELEGFSLNKTHRECSHSHNIKRSLLVDDKIGKPDRQWKWWPSKDEFLSHYLREIGFLAAFFQLMGATIFWVAGFTSVPSISSSLSTKATNGVFWLPQVVGGTGFIISGCLYMLETQKNWYTPALRVLGWHIGFWNFIGAIGFTLCGALGFAQNNSGAVFQSSLATFWGSWAFLIGSVIQWYESLDKNPVVMVASRPSAT